MIVETHFTPDELVRAARHRLMQYKHTPPSGPRMAGDMSTPDLIYYLAKHIERHCMGLPPCEENGHD
jgi:hypothetical protein